MISIQQNARQKKKRTLLHNVIFPSGTKQGCPAQNPLSICTYVSNSGVSPQNAGRKLAAPECRLRHRPAPKKKNWAANFFSHRIQFGICINCDQSSALRSFLPDQSEDAWPRGLLHISPASGSRHAYRLMRVVRPMTSVCMAALWTDTAS